MMSKTEIENRLSKAAPMREELKRPLSILRQDALPFHPLILVFATGCVSEEDCVPMRRIPMPKVGLPFDLTLARTLTEAFAENPSIHDGAIIFARQDEGSIYYLSAWSMRIVSRHVPNFSNPNLGSAHNSALSLSIAKNIDICCIVYPKRIAFFQCGESYLSED